MVLEGLSDKLKETLKKIANAPHIDKELVKEVMKDIQRALLQADVNVKLVLQLTKALETRALTEKPPAGMSAKEHVIRIIYQELVKILGKPRDVPLKKQVIMMVGLYGQGKTTTCGKLGRFFQKKGLKVGLIGCDVHRPAALDQLMQIGEQINVPVFGMRGEKDPVKIVLQGLEKHKELDVIIVDTSGRHALEDDLIEEMRNIFQAAKPDEKFLVMDATVGQQAGPQAKAFHEAVNISGVIITKMDGSAKGGGALSAVQETKAPVVFIGVGEHLNDLEKFDPSRFISRILGMGDLASLLEKVTESISEEDAKDVMEKISAGKFTLHEMEKQMEMISGIGPFQKFMNMLPFGISGKLSNQQMEETQKKLKRFKIIMKSMTKYEKDNPLEIKHSRINRIAKGAGVDTKDVKELLKYYNMSKKAIRGIKDRKWRKVLEKQMREGKLPM